ncbi:MAG: type II secretion system F family protein [Candidatus Methanomethyliales bacterium]|nr:type II secretion system F family protein [Candidatus Methanomethylicales archaeon]
MKKRLNIKMPSISALAYRLFGRWAELIIVYFEDLEVDIKRAGMKISLPRYISRMLLISLIGFIAAFFIPLPILITRTIPFYAITASAGLGVLVAGVAFWVMYILPSILASGRKGRIERALNFVVNYMAILSAAGVVPERVFRSLATSDIDPVIREEIADVVRRMEITGEDFYSALRRKADETASKQFSDLLKGILMVTRTGGDLKRYIYMQGKYFMRARRVALKKGLEQLGVLAEVYVTAGIVMPLVVVIMLSTMSLIGGGGINLILWLYFTTFLLIPLISIILIILIDVTAPKEE